MDQRTEIGSPRPAFNQVRHTLQWLQIYGRMGSLGPRPHLAYAECVGRRAYSSFESSLSLLDACTRSPVQEETCRVCQAVISSFSVAGFLFRARHWGISLKSYVLTSLSSPLSLPGARLSSQLLAKRHLLNYSSAEIVPWLLCPICPVVCH